MPKAQPQTDEVNAGTMGDESSDLKKERGSNWSNEQLEEDPKGEDVHIRNDKSGGNEARVEAEYDKGDDPTIGVEDEDYDPRLDGYKSGIESELKDAELACPEHNPHFKVATATRGKPYNEMPTGSTDLEAAVTFVNVEKFREVLLDYKVNEGFLLYFDHNDRRKVRAKCKVSGCPWKIMASATIGCSTFMIKSYVGTHTCDWKHRTSRLAVGAWFRNGGTLLEEI